MMGRPVNDNARCANFDSNAGAGDNGPRNDMATGYALAIKRMYRPGIILAAAKHNLREIAAEIGADSHIDAARVRNNFILRGPNTAASVAQLAESLMDAAGVTKLRKTAVRALELLFTLPAGTTINPGEYFERATCWAEQHFGVPVLSSLVHLDEGAPHCHVLMLPLVNGKMNGSDLHGGKAKLRAMQTGFHEEVNVKYGFSRQAPQKRLSAAARASCMARLRECFQMNTAISDNAIDVLLKPHAKDPESLLLALGIKMPPPQAKGKSFAAIMTAPCNPEPRNPIGKANRHPTQNGEIASSMERHPYTCVGKGFDTRSYSIDSQHHNVASPTTASVKPAEPSASDNMPSLNLSDDSQGQTLHSDCILDYEMVCGALAARSMAESGKSPAGASHQHATSKRIEIQIDATTLVGQRDTRQVKHGPARNKPAMTNAGPANIADSKFLGLQTVVAVSLKGPGPKFECGVPYRSYPTKSRQGLAGTHFRFPPFFVPLVERSQATLYCKYCARAREYNRSTHQNIRS